MTICVAVKVHDCLVFAADSATSLVGVDDAGKPAIVNVYAHGNKVYNLFKGRPICAMTCGMGNIGRSSISTLAKDLRRQIKAPVDKGGLDPDNFTVEEVAHRAKRFLYDENYLKLAEPPAGEHSLEFFVGGYSSASDVAEVWKIVLSNGGCTEPELQFGGTEQSYVLWSGQPEALNRLLIGFSGNLRGALAAAGVDEPNLDPVIELIKSHTVTSLVEDAMPIGDAIALADFLVDVTKKYVHFLRGADVVGGDTDIATVTRHEGFRWIKRKHHYPKELNLETDHV